LALDEHGRVDDDHALRPRIESISVSRSSDSGTGISGQDGTVHWLALRVNGEYQTVDRSSLVDVGPKELSARIDWPAVDHG
jgi:hypothetical protein